MPVNDDVSETKFKVWNSNYRATYGGRTEALNAQCADYVRLRGPPMVVQHPPTCLSEEKPLTSYATEYGILGSKPTDRLTIPGYTYNGRIPTDDFGLGTRVVEVREVINATIMKKVGDVVGEAKAEGESK